MQLPTQEASLLRSLPLPERRGRARQLREVGWTFASIGAPLSAPRSTARAWATHPCFTPTLQPVPLPPPPRVRRSLSSRAPLSSDAAREISLLAPVASTFRALSSPTSPAARARARLDQLVSHHHSRGVPTSQLARAARVSYRAMYVRVQRAARHAA